MVNTSRTNHDDHVGAKADQGVNLLGEHILAAGGSCVSRHGRGDLFLAFIPGLRARLNTSGDYGALPPVIQRLSYRP